MWKIGRRRENRENIVQVAKGANCRNCLSKKPPVFKRTMRAAGNKVPSCNVNNAPFSVNVSRWSSLKMLINDRMLKA